MPVGVVKALIALVFGVPMAISLVALLFGDVMIERIDGKEKPEGK